jgi:hypothetical protein
MLLARRPHTRFASSFVQGLAPRRSILWRRPRFPAISAEKHKGRIFVRVESPGEER